jgi:polysaccharide deacetylase family protein (PEP-CTERM system associated)
MADVKNIAPDMPDAFTIDVEDWFHILEVSGTPQFAEWDAMPSRLESNFQKLLDLLASHEVKATCFTLGWVARRFPAMLRRAAEQGHEMASHGFGHQVLHVLTREQMREDIRSAKAAIEDATGVLVRGYRAPGFSVTHRTPWVFDEIADAGYSFDSSVFPARHGHGGIPEAPCHPFVISTRHGNLIEFPMSIVKTPLGPFCFFGGGYLRLFPYRLIDTMARRVRRRGRGVIWYIHPREIDPEHPRLQMPSRRQFRSYVNLRGTSEKLRSVLGSSPQFCTLGEIAERLIATEVLASRS